MGFDDVFAGFKKLANADAALAERAGALPPPPPRDLNDRMQTFLKQRPRGPWLAIAIVFFVLNLPIVLMVPRLETIAWSAILLAVTILLWRSVRARRRVLEVVLREGEAVRADVAGVHTTEYRRNGRYMGMMVHLGLTIAGRQLRYSAMDETLSTLRPGMTMWVLQHPKHPDDIVPVLSVF